MFSFVSGICMFCAFNIFMFACVHTHVHVCLSTNFINIISSELGSLENAQV